MTATRDKLVRTGKTSILILLGLVADSKMTIHRKLQDGDLFLQRRAAVLVIQSDPIDHDYNVRYCATLSDVPDVVV